MTDELAARRGDKLDSESAHIEEAGSGGSRERRPPLWRWFSVQTHHSDPRRAAAALHVRDHFNLAFTRFSKIDRALAHEDSEHLVAFRELLDEYRTLYDIDAENDEFARETGVGGKMLPFAPEMCETCDKREAIPGTGRCARHGGQWITEKDLNDMSRRSREKIMVMVDSALRVMQDILDNGKSEQVRSQVAAMVLDRAGLGASVNVNHSGSVTIETADEAMVSLQARLSQLAVNAQKRAELEASIVSSEVIDAEVVPEPRKVAGE